MSWIIALRWNACFVQRDPYGLRLLHEKFEAAALHADAVVGFGDGGHKRCDLDVRWLQKRVQRHVAGFAAGRGSQAVFVRCRCSPRRWSEFSGVYRNFQTCMRIKMHRGNTEGFLFLSV